MNFQGLQLKSELFLSEKELQLVSCPGKSLEWWSPWLHSGIHRGIVGTCKQNSFRLFHYTIKNCGRMYIFLCFATNQEKKTWRHCKQYKECQDLQRELLGWEICLDTRVDIQGTMTPIVKDFAHLILHFSAQIPNSGEWMMTAVISEITVYYLFSIWAVAKVAVT